MTSAFGEKKNIIKILTRVYNNIFYYNIVFYGETTRYFFFPRDLISSQLEARVFICTRHTLYYVYLLCIYSAWSSGSLYRNDVHV